MAVTGLAAPLLKLYLCANTPALVTVVSEEVWVKNSISCSAWRDHLGVSGAEDACSSLRPLPVVFDAAVSLVKL